MEPKKITDGVWFVGAIDWDRRLFDSLIPLPDGTSYNAYLVKGKGKTALIDTVDPSMQSVLLSYLDGVDTIDFIIANHAEQDHSGTLPALLERYRDARVVSTEKGKRLLAEHLHIPDERIVAVNDGETLSLGDKTLEFMHTPWVHWPETMCTYLREDRLLFTCDLFGSHLAVSGLYEPDRMRVCEASKRYYAEVMMPFRGMIKRYIDRFEKLRVDIIAPSHGPLHKDPAFIVGFHREWVSDSVANAVVIPFVTMHGSTGLMVERLIERLSVMGVKAERFNLACTDTGKFAMSLVDAATIVFACPTVLAGAHPFAISYAFMTNALKPKLKFAGVMGSYGWGGKMEEQIRTTLSGLKLEYLPSIMIKGKPKDADFKAIDELAEKIAERHNGSGII